MTCSIRVVDAGLLSTVQDAGRPGLGSRGVPAGGAADMASYRLLNVILLNPPDAACIEVTLAGAAFGFDAQTLFAITGAPADAAIERADGVRTTVPCNTVCAANAGDVLRLSHTRAGARVYVGFAGGLDTPLAMGSRSTHITAGFPVPPLRAGDVLNCFAPAASPAVGTTIPPVQLGDHRDSVFRTTLRVLRGPHADMFPELTLEHLTHGLFTVASDSNRTGVRLRIHPPLPAPLTSILTEPMTMGFIQLPPSGQPIILGRDHPTTGGYPVVASVIAADLDAIGQLRPNQEVRLTMAGGPG